MGRFFLGILGILMARSLVAVLFSLTLVKTPKTMRTGVEWFICGRQLGISWASVEWQLSGSWAASNLNGR